MIAGLSECVCVCVRARVHTCMAIAELLEYLPRIKQTFFLENYSTFCEIICH